MIKNILFSLIGIISVLLLVYIWALIFNPFVSKISVDGKILNYDSLGDNKPNELVISVIEGNPMLWQSDLVHLVYKINGDGSFNINNIIGRKPSISFRNNEINYEYGPLKSDKNIIKVDFTVLIGSKRLKWDEDNLNYKFAK